MKVTEYFIKRPVLFWSLMVSILVGGILSFIQMPKMEDPVVTMKQAMVAVVYPGASAHEVELKVAQPIEDELRALPDVKKLSSECHDGMLTVTIEFAMGVSLDDLEQYFDLLRRKMNDVQPRLPQGCYPPLVIDDMMDVYGIFYALTGDGYTYPELNKYARKIRRELLGIKGVKRINIVGNRDEVINIIISKDKITRNGILPTQIMLALQNAGKTVNAGAFENDNERLQIYVSDALKDENDIRNLYIRTIQGTQVKLGDVAEVERAYAEPQKNGFFVDGKPAIAICLAMESDVIVPDVGKEVDARLEEIVKTMPAGMQTEKIFFQPDKVNTAISSFMINLLESVAVVILVLIFTMGFRSGAIIGFGLVLTIAVSFPLLLVGGTTLQRISLGAFIVAMGMLVDNAIVIMDGILIDKKRGFGPKTYLYRIGRHTALPLLGATIIAVSTFLCVYLTQGSVGEYAHDLFVVLGVSLIASWILALVQVPMCAKSWLPARENDMNGNVQSIMNSPIHRFVKRTIASLIKYRKTTIAVSVFVLAICGFGMTKVKNVFFPDFDYNQFIVECYFPAQTNPDNVREGLLDMSRLLKENKDIDRVAASMGSAPAHYCLVRPMTIGGDCYGELMVDCKDYATVMQQIPIVRELLRQQYPDVYIHIRKYNLCIGTTHSVEVEFSGPDPAVLRELSKKAENIMRRSPYVDIRSVQNNWKPTGKTLVADYNRTAALRSGIERGDVANALMAATDGLTVGALNDQERTVLINLNVRNNDGSRMDKLNDIPVWSMANLHVTDNDIKNLISGKKRASEIEDDIFKSVPLSSVTDGIHLSWDENVVMRMNGQRAIEAECEPNSDMEDATPAKLMASVKEEIDAIPLPPGYYRRWIGESDLENEAISGLMKYVPITLFLILMVLLLLFNDWRKVILIILCFPFVLCGIVPSLIAFHQAFTFMALVGTMGLMGMMVKNAIVLVDEIGRLQKEEHLTPYRAVIQATVSRVRPVTMASLTTIVGMIPLIPDPMYGSLAITVMGGLAMGTLITLVLLPVFYAALFRINISGECSEN